MSLVSLDVLEGNPVTSDTVQQTLDQICHGINLSSRELEDFTVFLAATHDAYQRVLATPDYVPSVDQERFPREDVHRPTQKENPHNLWAWKCTIKDRSSEPPSGLIAGKTVALKDNICVKDVPCLFGTEVITDWIPNTDATVVTRVLEAGGVVIGKAVCENLSMFAGSWSPATGGISNPYAEGYSAGGSSSGAAVAVARGEADFAIGGDQGGSIRLPAAHVGIVGLKPTYGLVPYTGIASLEHFIDHTGPLTKSAMDAAILLQVLAGADGADGRQLAGCPLRDGVPDYPALTLKGIAGFRVGIIKESLAMPTTDERVPALVVKAAQRFKDLGATVEEVSVPGHLLGPDVWAVVSRVGGVSQLLGRHSPNRGQVLNDLTSKLTPWTPEKFSKAFPASQNLMINGLYAEQNLPSELLGKATNLARKLSHEYNDALDKYDVIITPTMPWLPKTFPEPDASPLEKLSKCAGVTLNTCQFNLTGHPAISIPVGFLPALEDEKVKLPVGMQIVSKWWEDNKVLAVAHMFEQGFSWKTPM